MLIDNDDKRTLTVVQKGDCLRLGSQQCPIYTTNFYYLSGKTETMACLAIVENHA